MKSVRRVPYFVLVLLLAACASTTAYTPTGKIEVLSLGHSAFRITTMIGKVIVIDPWLKTNPKTPAQYKDLSALGKVDAILVTHGHPDHVTDAPELAKINKTRVHASSGLIRALVFTGTLPTELGASMNKGGTVTPIGSDIKITMVRAEHSSEFVWRNPATGKDDTVFGGEPVGFIIELENGFKIYHMGDTGLFGDMKLIGDYYTPHLVLIPIGGHATLHPREAAYAIREYLKPRFVIPMHYGTFAFLAGKPEDFVAALGDAPTKAIVLQPGEKATF